MSGTRVTFYLRNEVSDAVTLVSKRMGISKSILVNKLLEVPLNDLVELLAIIPEKPTGADILRFKGRSMEVVNERVQQMRDVLEEKDNG
mgnify:CR=1 FL=1